MIDTKLPEPKYYCKWGMPARPPREHFSQIDWSFITTSRQRPELYIPPKLWNQIVHELLYTEDTQATIAGRLGTRRKYVRAVVAGIGSMIPMMLKLDQLGPRQEQILERKIKKRQSQSTIARALGISKQRVSKIIPHLEKKFEKSLVQGRGGVDSYFGVKATEPVATPDVNPDFTPKIDAETYSQFVRSLQVKIRKRGRRSWWTKR